jgi:hypothetical protein
MPAFTPEQIRKGQEARQRARREGRRPKTAKEKMAGFAGTFAELRAEAPKFALPLIGRAEKGSLAAAVKVKCLQCAAWQTREIRDCTVTGCALYPHRPYQTLKGRNANDSGPPSAIGT